ncbi:alpha/beta hydrolase [Roseobacter sp. YSTF-M11]|uniref:Alpha/beta hydrolase n=1 Tax=Roseobacter insulae TaxID=2859783 RepID=A0A9X1FVJ6_9RHOB|nr:alpha/beta hydrolase [Roseobacter insulae]MBW4708800.1 alpha/beta hydrolase [Roseobacter insulae]
MSVLSLLMVVVVIGLVQWRASAREASAEALYPPSGQIIDVDGTDIHVRVEGSGPDVVLIHGASGSMRDFTFDLVGRLSDRYRVITLDRPGLGWSNRPRPGYGGAWSNRAEPPTLQARLMQAAADAVGITNPVVVGHSYGGAVALAWALERPEDTGALVLLGAASNPWPGDLGLFYQINSSKAGGALAIPLITAFAPSQAIENTVREIFAPQKIPDGYLDHIGPEMTLRRTTQRANAQQVNSLRPYVVEMAKKYPTLTTPVEILHGTADTIVPLQIHSEPLAKLLPNANLIRLEGVGHMPHHAEPGMVSDAIDRAARRAGLR